MSPHNIYRGRREKNSLVETDNDGEEENVVIKSKVFFFQNLAINNSLSLE